MSRLLAGCCGGERYTGYGDHSPPSHQHMHVSHKKRCAPCRGSRERGATSTLGESHSRPGRRRRTANTVNGAQTFGAAAASARPGARHRTTQTRPPALRAAPAASHGDGDLGSEGEEHGRGLLEVADPGVGEAGHHRPVDDAVVGRPAHLGEDEGQVSTRGVGPSPPRPSRVTRRRSSGARAGDCTARVSTSQEPSSGVL